MSNELWPYFTITAREFWIILGMAVATFLCRYPLMTLAGRLTLSPGFSRILTYVGPAVLAAVIAPEIFTTAEPAEIAPFLNARLIAGLAAAGVAWKTHNVWLTILTGLGVLMLVRYLM